MKGHTPFRGVHKILFPFLVEILKSTSEYQHQITRKLPKNRVYVALIYSKLLNIKQGSLQLPGEETAQKLKVIFQKSILNQCWHKFIFIWDLALKNYIIKSKLNTAFDKALEVVREQFHSWQLKPSCLMKIHISPGVEEQSLRHWRGDEDTGNVTWLEKVRSWAWDSRHAG